MRNLRKFILVISMTVVLGQSSPASNHYTFKQLDALETRVGGEYWINAPNRPAPLFFAAPASNAASFHPADNQSFEITELVGRANKNPYYKVKFDTGRIAYLRPETFLEEFNASIAGSDPLAEEKRKAELAARDEKQRLAWIKAQAWPPAVKEAAIKKQPTPGLNRSEIRQVLGPPKRIAKLGKQGARRGPTQVDEERWYYADGMVLWFRNDSLSRVDRSEMK